MIARPFDLARFGRFVSVGSVGAGLNFGLTFVLAEGGLHYLLAAAIGIESAFLFNFAGNAYWTFGDSTLSGVGDYLAALGRDHLVRGAGLVTNLSILWVLVEFVGVWYLFGHLIGAAVAVLVNFSGNYSWVFSARE